MNRINNPTPSLEYSEQKYNELQPEHRTACNHLLMTLSYAEELDIRGLLQGPKLLTQEGKIKAEELIAQHHSLTINDVMRSLAAIKATHVVEISPATLLTMIPMIMALHTNTLQKYFKPIPR